MILALIVVFAAGISVGMWVCNRRLVRAARAGVHVGWRQVVRLRWRLSDG